MRKKTRVQKADKKKRTNRGEKFKSIVATSTKMSTTLSVDHWQTGCNRSAYRFLYIGHTHTPFFSIFILLRNSSLLLQVQLIFFTAIAIGTHFFFSLSAIFVCPALCVYNIYVFAVCFLIPLPVFRPQFFCCCFASVGWYLYVSMHGFSDEKELTKNTLFAGYP